MNQGHKLIILITPGVSFSTAMAVVLPKTHFTPREVLVAIKFPFYPT